MRYTSSSRRFLRNVFAFGAMALVSGAPLLAQEGDKPAGAAGMSESANPKEGEILAQAVDVDVMTAANFTYDPRGRRDPFLSIWDIKKGPTDRPPGIRGMEISELDLQGIVLSGGEKYAIMLGTDNKGYNLHEGDELFNGKVKSIEKDRVTFLQKVSDPLSIKEYTEITKRLNPEER